MSGSLPAARVCAAFVYVLGVERSGVERREASSSLLVLSPLLLRMGRNTAIPLSERGR